MTTTVRNRSEHVGTFDTLDKLCKKAIMHKKRLREDAMHAMYRSEFTNEQ
jgi:hypothetical protein